MPLTSFVDFILKSGPAKVTVVRDFKTRGEYEPFADFYKKIREGIVDMHRCAKPKSALDALVAGLADAKKQNNYPEIVRGYKKFLGKKQISWFDPPRADWQSGSITVSVNPELGLDIEGQPTTIKLYLKAPTLTKARAEVIAHLMKIAFPVGVGGTCAILDVRRGRLFQPPTQASTHGALVIGEALSFGAIYAQV